MREISGKKGKQRIVCILRGNKILTQPPLKFSTSHLKRNYFLIHSNPFSGLSHLHPEPERLFTYPNPFSQAAPAFSQRKITLKTQKPLPESLPPSL
jgi:hypothetical protein